MTTAAVALALPYIQRFEAWRPFPYRDVAGVWTIGWGFTRLENGSPVSALTPEMPREQGDAMLLRLLTARADQVDALLPEDATDNQRAALYSFAWNEGVGALKHSTLLRKFCAGDLLGAAMEFGQWVYAGGRRVDGLVNRRRQERDLFAGVVPADATTEG